MLNWNGAALTAACMRSVDVAAGLASRVHLTKVVVDNGSTPADRAQLVQCVEGADDWQLIISHQNRGFAGGMNYGLSSLDLQSIDRILFLNNDIILRPECLAELANHTTQATSEVISGVVLLNGDGRSLQTIGGYKYFPWLGLAHPIGAGKDPDGELIANSAPDYISGALMLVSRSLLDRAGKIPDRNFLYFEELNLMRYMGRNETIGVCLRAFATHAGGKSAQNLSDNENASYYAALACFRYTASTAAYKLPSVIVARLLGLLIRSTRGKNTGELRAALKALRYFLTESG